MYEDWNYEDEVKEQKKPQVKSLRKGFLRMSPPERFVIATMMMVITCILGAFCLLITNRMGVPFF